MLARLIGPLAIATLVTTAPVILTGCVATMPVTTVSEVTIRPKDAHLYQNGMYHYVIPGTNQFYTTKKKLRKPVTLQVTQQKMVPIMSAQLAVQGPGPGYPPPREEPPPPREEPPPQRVVERVDEPPGAHVPIPRRRVRCVHGVSSGTMTNVTVLRSGRTLLQGARVTPPRRP